MCNGDRSSSEQAGTNNKLGCRDDELKEVMQLEIQHLRLVPDQLLLRSPMFLLEHVDLHAQRRLKSKI